MSGSTIGGVVGGVVGWFVGGPAGAQWGWMIGSAVGGVVDPERIEGPRLGEARTQTSSDGVPLIYGYGDFPCAGNVTWVDEVKEHRNVESAKGGPEQVTYTYTISYMVVVCKGEISGYKLIRRNGKIVYDARTDAELTALGYTSQEISETRAAQASFLQRATLYYGTDTQMPDPTMVAVKGAGNVPAYTGIAYIVMKDDETQQGEYAQFEFVVANCGDRTDEFSQTDQLLVTGQAINVGDPMFAMGTATETPSFVGLPQSSGANIIGMPLHYAGMLTVIGNGAARYSTDFGQTWESSNTAPVQPQGFTVGHAGWLAYNHTLSLTGIGAWHADPVPEDWTVYYPGNGVWHVSYAAGYYWFSSPGSLRRSLSPAGPWTQVSTDLYDWVDIVEYSGDLYATAKPGSGDGVDWQIRRSADGGATWADLLLTVPASGHKPYFLCGTPFGLFAWCLGGGLWTNANGWSGWIDTGIGGSGTDTQLWQVDGGRKIAYANEMLFLLGPTNQVAVFDPDTLTVVSTATLPIADAEGITTVSPPLNYDPIPDAPGFYIDRTTGNIIGPAGTQIDPCRPSLGEIVADQCGRRGVSSRDVSELSDFVDGYRIAKPSSPQSNIQGLQPGYFFGASEFDGTLHFPKRGRPVTFTLTHGDFLERDGDPIKWERTQERDFLRKVTVAYSDPETAWTPTTQQAERRAATIRAEGESTLELPITGNKDWAAQTAHKSIKVAWGEPDECTFHVTIDYANLVTGAEGLVPYTDGNPTQIRIDRIEDEGLTRMVTGRITRPDLYESNASGTSKPLPQFPGSSIRGPTDGVLMNIPVLIDQDDRPGIHWAVSRMMSGWQGGTLQIRRAGQWVTVDTISDSAGMGALTAPLPAHSGDIDTQNILSVRMNEEVESVSWMNLLQERNPLAILRPDGTAEIVQFQNATQTATDEYDLTKLIRNRLDTGSWDHDTGARVVVLDSRVQYATLQSTDLGQTLEYRFVSVGTDPDAAPIQTITLTTMESQREWPVYMLEVEQDGDDFILTWLARDRLGNDLIPIRSQNWAGYEVSYSHSGGNGSVVVMTETHTFTLPGASDVTFSVAQLNQFTGAGPAETVTSP
jgi:hypothetical protein